MTTDDKSAAGAPGISAPPPPEQVFPDPRLQAAARAAERGDAQRIRDIVARSAGDPAGPVDLEAASPSGANLLMYAILTRSEVAVRTLLEVGANPNHLTPRGDSPLLAAAVAGDPRFLDLLLDHGGNPDLKTLRGEPLLLQLITHLSWDGLRLLLDRGANVDAADALGQTAVLKLARSNQYEEVHRLLARGADPHRADATGATLRALAARPLRRLDSPEEAWRKRVVERLDGVTG